ncbi:MULTISPECIES: BrnT family toxin [Gordonibacter]|uniref:BrnT family toxin n=1 Tax=Gordonibacter faecis TaxID=3047475 RepID=A0ABT7DJ16_9ACTN|nr:MULTISPECIES: BrnT family toxin [unclassified Gordonibacter]MDJ1649247.1 BrnT family toxin [Gordonibacter sp. KGMB12511]HIW76233.1 BrnT family toxin [Candidatus Gordonibacter avicola]
MQFEYDPYKSEQNFEKYGMDFELAQDLWLDEDRVEFKVAHSGEQRYGVLARFAGTCWLAVVTYRSDRIRIISVRKATRKEMSLYDKINNC